jgi:hypothetical protein
VGHIFSRQVGILNPYFKIGTGLYAINEFLQQGAIYTHCASVVLADVSLGVGTDFEIAGATFNLDVSWPGLMHETFLGAPLFSLNNIISVGYKYNF